MNKFLKNTLIFLSGAIVGSGVTYFVCKKTMTNDNSENCTDEEGPEIHEEDSAKELARINSERKGSSIEDFVNSIDIPDEAFDEEDDSQYFVVEDPTMLKMEAQAEDIHTRLERKWGKEVADKFEEEGIGQEIIPGSKMTEEDFERAESLEKKIEEDWARKREIEELMEKSQENDKKGVSDDMEGEIHNIFDESIEPISRLDDVDNTTFDKNIHVISPDEYGLDDEYDMRTLSLYEDGYVVDDKTGDLIDNPYEILGKEWADSVGIYEEDTVWVCNDTRRTYYEVTLLDYKFFDKEK